MSNTPKRLRVVEKGYAGHTGEFGGYEFVDGVSVDYLPQNVRDRLSAALRMEEVEDDGTSQEASVAARLLRERSLVAENTRPLKRQTEDEKLAENAAALLGGEKVIPVYSKAALEALAEREGISGLRALVTEHNWNARSKAIPDLIERLLSVQTEYVNDRIEALVKRGASRADAEALFKLIETPPAAKTDPVVTTAVVAREVTTSEIAANSIKAETILPGVITSAQLEAAAIGDLSAAVSLETTDKPAE